MFSVHQFRNGAYYNNEKFGIYSIAPFGREEDEGERARVDVELYTTDYFTHRIMKEVCKQLVQENCPYLRQISYAHLGDNRIFFTSLGVNVILQSTSKARDVSVILCEQSTNASKIAAPIQSVSVIEGGIPGMIWTSQIAMGHETELTIRIFGEKGSIEWSHLKPWELRVTRINQPPQTYTTNRDYLYPAAKELCRLPSGHIEGFYEAFGNIYHSFCVNLIAKKTGGDPGTFRYPTVEDGVRGIEFVDACLKSNANNNIWVKVRD